MNTKMDCNCGVKGIIMFKNSSINIHDHHNSCQSSNCSLKIAEYVTCIQFGSCAEGYGTLIEIQNYLLGSMYSSYLIFLHGLGYPRWYLASQTRCLHWLLSIPSSTVVLSLTMSLITKSFQRISDLPHVLLSIGFLLYIWYRMLD